MSIQSVAKSVTLCATLGSALATALLQYPIQPSKEALKKFGLASLQGTVFAVASLALSAAVAMYAFQKPVQHAFEEKPNPHKDAYSRGIFLCSMAVCGLAVGGAARAFPDRLGTPTEVLINFAISSVLGSLGSVNILFY